MQKAILILPEDQRSVGRFWSTFTFQPLWSPRLQAGMAYQVVQKGIQCSIKSDKNVRPPDPSPLATLLRYSFCFRSLVVILSVISLLNPMTRPFNVLYPACCLVYG